MDFEARDFQTGRDEGTNRGFSVDRRQARLQHMRVVAPIGDDPVDILAFERRARPIGIPLCKLARFGRGIEGRLGASGGAQRQQHARSGP